MKRDKRKKADVKALALDSSSPRSSTVLRMRSLTLSLLGEIHALMVENAAKLKPVLSGAFVA